MTCREFVEFLYRYVEGELAPDERTGFDEHLERCPHCVNYLHGYRETTRLLRCSHACDLRYWWNDHRSQTD